MKDDKFIGLKLMNIFETREQFSKSANIFWKLRTTFEIQEHFLWTFFEFMNIFLNQWTYFFIQEHLFDFC